MKTIIIEDEVRSRKILENSIRNYCGQLKLMGYAASVQEGIETIKLQRPDLIFLDIDLADGSGFDLLDMLPKPWPKIIFVTAYNQFAVKAFQISAIDYLLKPVDPDLLIKAVGKALNTAESAENQEKKVDVMKENRGLGKFNKMVLPTLNGIQLIRVDDIVRLESDGNYTTFFLQNKTKILVSRQIKEYETILEEQGFFRVHQSHIINMHLVERYIKGEGGTVILEDGSQIEVARRRKEEFLRRITS